MAMAIGRLASLMTSVLVACAPAQPRARSEPAPDASAEAESIVGAEAGLAPDATAEASVSAPDDVGSEVVISSACPTAWVNGGSLCTPTGKTCSFPEGTCTCAPQSYCGGAAPDPDTVERLSVPRWLCMPSPKLLRPDGCPLGMPSGACKTPGKKCVYTPCCVVTLTCTGGIWRGKEASCPP